MSQADQLQLEKERSLLLPRRLMKLSTRAMKPQLYLISKNVAKLGYNKLRFLIINLEEVPHVAHNFQLMKQRLVNEERRLPVEIEFEELTSVRELTHVMVYMTGKAEVNKPLPTNLMEFAKLILNNPLNPSKMYTCLLFVTSASTFYDSFDGMVPNSHPPESVLLGQQIFEEIAKRGLDAENAQSPSMVFDVQAALLVTDCDTVSKSIDNCGSEALCMGRDGPLGPVFQQGEQTYGAGNIFMSGWNGGAPLPDDAAEDDEQLVNLEHAFWSLATLAALGLQPK